MEMQWIKCTENQPKNFEHKRFIVCINGKAVDVCYYNGKTWQYGYDDGRRSDVLATRPVTHWMEFPPPPQD